jgi:cyclopropane fatty-acyl-phospholipid synthase-like methyltransferase
MELTFDDFKKRARDTTLSKWEKIGFPDEYRKDTEYLIFQDIILKANLEKANSVLDIGCGCSGLVEHFIDFSRLKGQSLFLVDSDEMLTNISRRQDMSNVKFIPGLFPDPSVLFELRSSTFDSIIVYSVIQYVFIYQSIFSFIHSCVELLNPGGYLLVGDIPNFQSRQRFLATPKGQAFLNEGAQSVSSVKISHEDYERIDDSVVLAILLRFRSFGCETYLLPQANGLPFSNRREDILIIKR